MFKDAFDKLCWLLLVLTLAALVALLLRNEPAGAGKASAGINKAVEREMAYRARTELIEKLFARVEQLRKEGKSQEALLRLDELIRKYPGEAHGYIVQGEILRDMGVLDEAIASFVEGVKLNGDYVDSKSPFSRRAEIGKLVEEGMKSIEVRRSASPGNQSLAVTGRKINYLRSRLAGGCE